MFEDGKSIKIDEAIFKNINKDDVLNYVYNSKTSGETEILRRLSNRKEVAFKLKTSDKPFALIKIGDISGWLKDELAGYEVQERFEDESYFKNLNREDSDINILMGSRSFYEGWDSNRPNVINYINIGMGEDARKFILQSVGRGVRIEPLKNKRKRLLSLHNTKEISEDLFNRVKNKALPIESLFLFGTNREALKTVIGSLEKEKKRKGETQLPLFIINPEAKKRKLLVPIYKEADYPVLKTEKPVKFEISDKDLEILERFVEFVPDDRLLLMKYSENLKRMPVEKIKAIRKSMNKKENFYKTGERGYKKLDVLIERIFDYFSVVPERFDTLKKLDNEIKHFWNIKVYLEDISEIQEKVERVKNYPNQVKELQGQYGKVSPQEYIEMAKNLRSEEDFETAHKEIKIKYIANHYYTPLILSLDEKVDYIKHIIKTQSEVNFINDLEDHLTKADNKFKEFGWWLFSKLDESLDEVYIPYYNPNANKFSRFYPDFIFWLKKGNNYFIVFIDPKGTEHADWADKLNGYKEIFEEMHKEINYNGFKVKIKLLFRARDASIVQQRFPEHSQYWFDNIDTVFEGLNTE